MRRLFIALLLACGAVFASVETAPTAEADAAVPPKPANPPKPPKPPTPPKAPKVTCETVYLSLSGLT